MTPEEQANLHLMRVDQAERNLVKAATKYVESLDRNSSSTPTDLYVPRHALLQAECELRSAVKALKDLNPVR